MLKSIKASACGKEEYSSCMLTFLLIPIALLAALGWLAVRFGAESRPGFDERRTRSDHWADAESYRWVP